RVGSRALGVLSPPARLEARPRAAAAGRGAAVKDKAVALLSLAGGPSHIETFDPRMDAPEGVRSVTGEVATAIPGVTFGGTFPGLARRAEALGGGRGVPPKDKRPARGSRRGPPAGGPPRGGGGRGWGPSMLA